MAIVFWEDKQNYHVTGEEAGKLHSQSYFDATVSLHNSDETLTIPVQTCTTVWQLKELLAVHMGYIQPGSINLVCKRGCAYKKLFDSDQVVRKMVVTGVKSLKPERTKYPHPYGIIGAGYNGLKTAIFFETRGIKDYIIFDRYDRVGGHCWLEMANKTTKLQTEFPTYHIWYGEETSNIGTPWCGGPPVNHYPWPSRDELIEHFQKAAEDFGIIPNVRFKTNVSEMDVMDAVNQDAYYVKNRSYRLKFHPVNYEIKEVQGGGALQHQSAGEASLDAHLDKEASKYRNKMEQVNVSCLVQWPGALSFPRHVVYKGEELFGGPMDYAVEMRFDYSHVKRSVVTIIGHGAFTMENIRTCLENCCKKIFLLCRKLNLTCPRPVSWFINQSNPPITAPHTLDMLQHGYKHINIDPWGIHSVHGNADRTIATVIQKTRFGIGDVYFLAHMYGLMEIKLGNVKRCTHKTLHLDTGDTIECDCVLKCTGCLGDWKVDKLLKIKEMVGFWVNGDYRRVCAGEADGIHAAAFSFTTGGPGMYSMNRMMLHFWDCPTDFERLERGGVITQLPVHRAGEPNEEFPAYFFTALHSSGTAIMLVASCPLLQHMSKDEGAYKHFIQTHCLPLQKLIEEAKADWEAYEKKFRDEGMVSADAPYIPYFYTEEYMEEQFKNHEKNISQQRRIANR